MANGIDGTTATGLVGLGGLLIGVITTVASFMGKANKRDKDVDKKIAEGDAALQGQIHKQEVHCAEVSSAVLARLGNLEDSAKAQNRKLDYLVGWARNGGGGSGKRGSDG